MQNKVFLIGRIGNISEMSKGAIPVLRLSLATSKKVKGEDVVAWHNIVCFDKLAKFLNEYGQKGALISVEGEISYSKYIDKTGNEKNKTEITAQIVQMLKWPADKEQKASDQPAQNYAQQSTPADKPPVDARKYARKSLKEQDAGLYDPLPDDDMPF